MSEPRYDHDCEKCIFLGHFQGSDFYYCTASHFMEPPKPRLVRREGYEPYQYGFATMTRWYQVCSANICGYGDALKESARRGLIDKTLADATLAGISIPTLSIVL